MRNLPNLTDLERRVLADLLRGWDDNGGDFGFIEDVVNVPMRQARGIITSLQRKQLIYVHEAEGKGEDRCSQFDFCETETDPEGRELAERIRLALEEKQ